MSEFISQELITDKGFFDAVWCPEQWKDLNDHDNRVKTGRKNDSLELIRQALSLGERNRLVNIAEIPPLGRKAVPFRESFWLHIPFREGSFLLTTHSFTLDPITSGEGVLTVVRQRRYDPREEESYRAEAHLQVLIYNKIRQFFSRVKDIVIVSRYPTWPEQSLSSVTLEQTLKAEEFSCYINDQRLARVESIPRTERCPYCWWKDCPSRNKSSRPAGKISLLEGALNPGTLESL